MSADPVFLVAKMTIAARNRTTIAKIEPTAWDVPPSLERAGPLAGPTSRTCRRVRRSTFFRPKPKARSACDAGRTRGRRRGRCRACRPRPRPWARMIDAEEEGDEARDHHPDPRRAMLHVEGEEDAHDGTKATRAATRINVSQTSGQQRIVPGDEAGDDIEDAEQEPED